MKTILLLVSLIYSNIYAQNEAKIRTEVMALVNGEIEVPTLEEYKKASIYNKISEQELIDFHKRIKDTLEKGVNKVKMLGAFKMQFVFKDTNTYNNFVQYLYELSTAKGKHFMNVVVYPEQDKDIILALDECEMVENSLMKTAKKVPENFAYSILYYVLTSSSYSEKMKFEAFQNFMNKHNYGITLEICDLIHVVEKEIEGFEIEDTYKWIDRLKKYKEDYYRHIEIDQKVDFEMSYDRLIYEMYLQNQNSGYYIVEYVKKLIREYKFDRARDVLNSVECDNLLSISYLQTFLEQYDSYHLQLKKKRCISLPHETSVEYDLLTPKVKRGDKFQLEMKVYTNKGFESDVKVYLLKNQRELPIQKNGDRYIISFRVSSPIVPSQRSVDVKVKVKDEIHVKDIKYEIIE